MSAPLIFPIRIEDDQVELCRKFAEECVGTNVSTYAMRGQHNRDKIMNDIFTGKLGEIGVYEFLREFEFDVAFPDFEIYTGRKKSWSADMSIKFEGRDLRIHCKTQTQSSVDKYGKSWILQYSGTGKGHQDRLFKSADQDDFMALSIVRHHPTHGYFVDVLAVLQFIFLRDSNLLEEPVLSYLAATKKAIYFESLEAAGPNNLFSILSLRNPEI